MALKDTLDAIARKREERQLMGRSPPGHPQKVSLKLSRDRPKQNLQSHHQPNRSVEDVVETRGFARKNEDGRHADRRLANRCIRLAVSEASRTYTDSDVC